MINNIYLESFKCFSKADIMLAPLTLLTGLNSSGKSSVMQAIRIITGGKLLEGFGDCVSNLGTQAKITVEIDDGEYSAIISKGSRTLSIDKITPSILANYVQYIGASRLGPQNYLPYSKKPTDIGEKGENVLSYIETYDSGVPECMRREHYEVYSSVKEQTRAWLDIISPGLQFDYEVVESADIAISKFSDFRSVDVGFGLSYTLPIIVSVLVNTAKKAKNPNMPITMLLENPEAHLHPRGQTEMGIFLALASSCGIQIIVETHSDHLLNGARIAVKDRRIEPHNMIVHYFEYDVKEEKSNHYPIFVDEYGALNDWPEGFFDENEKNLLKLI
ncbi:MAG: DUF3696 domain-containing protein [Oscillospiraceae bacterium]|nr:DUF3696 domain-containing protein [Oscillospiraceae bacterium]